MENASKALLMAGGMLIAVLTVTLLVMMFNRIGIFYSNEGSVASEEEIVKFNLEYEAYNREDVRGTELFSLLNKVANYNDRKSNIGNEGLNVGYEPIEVTINLGDLKGFTADGENPKLITKKTYTEKTNNSTFRSGLKKDLDEIISKYSENSLENLSKSITKIFISNDSIQEKKDNAVDSYNKLSLARNEINSFDKIAEGSTIREDIYKYYEYVQLKRAHFRCTSTEYDKTTGRIIKMKFEFTGTFE